MMKNKMVTRLYRLVLALVVGLTILPVTALAEEAHQVYIGLADHVYAKSEGSNVQEISNFQTIFLETDIGYVFTDNTVNELNKVLEAKGLKAYISGDTGKNNTELSISKKDSADVSAITVDASTYSSTLVADYVIYQGKSIVGETGDENKMNAQYDSANDSLTFNGGSAGGIESIGTDGTRNINSFLDGNSKKNFSKFYINVDATSINGVDTTHILNFYLGGSDTTYSSSSTTNPSIYLKKIIAQQKNLSNTDIITVTVNAYSAEGCIGDAYKFIIDAGTVESILAKATVSVELPKGLKKAEKSGDLTQTVSMGSEFKDIILEVESGYVFTADSINKIGAALKDTNLEPVIDSRKTLKISAQYGDKNIKNATVKADDFVLTQTYIMYNDAISKVGQTGDNNKMNAKYDNATGILTFDCNRIGALEYYDQNGKRSDYNGFSRFYVTVYDSDEKGEIDGYGKNLKKEFNLGDGSGATAADPDYASSSTIDPYIYLKKLVQENSENLKSTDVIWVKVRACDSIMLGEGNVFFKIRVGTVEEILKDAEKKESIPTKKSTAGWDDGSPFTTDKCGNVFDRWGNKIYEAKGCNVGGYNLVRTSVED